MNTKQFYKHMLENSYRLGDCHYDAKSNAIEANIFIGNNDFDVENFLVAHDFFVFSTDLPVNDKNAPKMTVNFVYDNRKWDVYELSVSDMFDTRKIFAGNDVVVACASYKLIDQHVETAVEKPKETPVSDIGSWNPFSDSVFGKLFSIPKFAMFDFDEMVKSAQKNGSKCFIRQTVNDNGKVTEKVFKDGKLIQSEYESCPSCTEDTKAKTDGGNAESLKSLVENK